MMGDRAARALGCLLAVSLAAPAADGQRVAPGRRAAITGRVFDSLSRRPLANALVQMADARSPAKSWAARSDATGSFAFDSTTGLPAGTYLVEFFHPLVDSLGLRMPSTVLRVDTAALQLTLATPSAETIVNDLCGAHERADSSGAVLGYVRDARDDQPREGVRVAVEWTEYVITRGQFAQRVATRTSHSGAGGFFAVCGVPNGFEVQVSASGHADSSGHFGIEVPARGIAHRDVYVGRSIPGPVRADSQATDSTRQPARRGSARLKGRIATSNGAAIPGARVTVLESASEVRSNGEGQYVLDSLPAGTYTLDVHAVGFVPASHIIDLRESREEAHLVDLTPIAVFLDTVFTRVQRSYAGSVIQEFERRKRIGDGFFIEENEIRRRSPPETTNLLRSLRGLTIARIGDYNTAVFVSSLGAASTMQCMPDVFVDGTVVRDGALMINELVRPSEIRALEVYVRGARVPPQFLTRHSCGAIVFWTRGRMPRDERRTP